jgi:hypothetical protein
MPSYLRRLGSLRAPSKSQAWRGVDPPLWSYQTASDLGASTTRPRRFRWTARKFYSTSSRRFGMCEDFDRKTNQIFSRPAGCDASQAPLVRLGGHPPACLRGGLSPQGRTPISFRVARSRIKVGRRIWGPRRHGIDSCVWFCSRRGVFCAVMIVVGFEAPGISAESGDPGPTTRGPACRCPTSS